MKQYLLRILLAAFAVITPSLTFAENCVELAPMTAEADAVQSQRVELKAGKSNLQIHLFDCQGKTLQVYDIAGNLKYSLQVEANDKTVSLNLPKGVYLVSVGGITKRALVA